MRKQDSFPNVSKAESAQLFTESRPSLLMFSDPSCPQGTLQGGAKERTAQAGVIPNLHLPHHPDCVHIEQAAKSITMDNEQTHDDVHLRDRTFHTLRPKICSCTADVRSSSSSSRERSHSAAATLAGADAAAEGPGHKEVHVTNQARLHAESALKQPVQAARPPPELKKKMPRSSCSRGSARRVGESKNVHLDVPKNLRTCVALRREKRRVEYTSKCEE